MLALVIAVAALLPRATGKPISTDPPRVSGLFPCLSYAPFRRPGHTPMDPSLRITREQILEDLRLLQPLTTCVRLYGTSHGQDQVPGVAASLGLQVVLGAWIGRDAAANQVEIDTALRLAHAHPGTVRMVVVGNEVLLRQEQSPQAMAQLLRQARDRSPVPVTYADVWEFWLRHAPNLIKEVDVVAVHILPYWEDEPVALKESVNHVQAIHRQVHQAFEGKPVWLAETGWPAAGRQRGPAVPGPREQALFVRELHVRMDEAGIDYNLIEAFDQPWKRQLEGAMGGAWGLIDADGTLRDRDTHGLPHEGAARGALIGGALGFVGAVALMGWRARRRSTGHGISAHVNPNAPMNADLNASSVPSAVPRFPHALLVACAALTIGLLLGRHLADWAVWLRTPMEWAIGVVVIGLAGLAITGALARTALGPPAPRENPGAAAAEDCTPGTVAAQTWCTMLLFVLAWQALTLVADGRYRPLPAALVAAVAVAMWAERILGGRAAPSTPAQRLMASAFMLAAPILVALEGWANAQACALAAAWLTLGMWVWLAPLHHAPCTGDPGAEPTPEEPDPPATADFKPSSAHNRTAAADRSAS